MEASSEQPQQEPTTDDLLRQVLAQQEQHRAEVAALREQLAAARAPAPTASATPQSAEDLLAARMSEIANHDFYCPGCGALYDYRQRCTGTGDQPHQAIEVVSTDELKEGDSSKHTPAPASA